MRAYAHARERMIIGIFTIHFLIVFIIPQSWKSIHPLLEKKQAVVFIKTSRRFQQNNTSFSTKQAVDREERSRNGLQKVDREKK